MLIRKTKKKSFVFQIFGDDSFLSRNSNHTMQQYLRSISNCVILERGMDDNTYWFTDETNQLLKHQQPAPLGLATGIVKPSNETSTLVAAGQRAVSHLCSEKNMVKQSFVLESRASVAVFLDAWLPYQTVPIRVTVCALQVPVRYSWQFRNYVPIGNAPTQGSGMAMLQDEGLIIRTLGHTARSPTGEFPLSRETLEKTCIHESERPMLFFRNIDNAPMTMTIAIGV